MTTADLWSHRPAAHADSTGGAGAAAAGRARRPLPPPPPLFHLSFFFFAYYSFSCLLASAFFSSFFVFLALASRASYTPSPFGIGAPLGSERTGHRIDLRPRGAWYRGLSTPGPFKKAVTGFDPRRPNSQPRHHDRLSIGRWVPGFGLASETRCSGRKEYCAGERLVWARGWFSPAVGRGMGRLSDSRSHQFVVDVGLQRGSRSFREVLSRAPRDFRRQASWTCAAVKRAEHPHVNVVVTDQKIRPVLAADGVAVRLGLDANEGTHACRSR